MKRITTILLLLAAGIFSATAQTDVTEITVNDEQSGREEVIQLPEGMTAAYDSLLNEWMAKNIFIPTPPVSTPM